MRWFTVPESKQRCYVYVCALVHAEPLWIAGLCHGHVWTSPELDWFHWFGRTHDGPDVLDVCGQCDGVVPRVCFDEQCHAVVLLGSVRVAISRVLSVLPQAGRSIKCGDRLVQLAVHTGGGRFGWFDGFDGFDERLGVSAGFLRLQRRLPGVHRWFVQRNGRRHELQAVCDEHVSAEHGSVHVPGVPERPDVV